MSERKDKRKLNQLLPQSYNTLYESRIVSSYPFYSLARSHINKVISPIKGQILINCNKQQGNRQLGEFRQPSVQSKRPKSLDFQNNLFLKLASKIQKQKQIQQKRNEEVINEYYNPTNKQNYNASNNQKQRQFIKKPSIRTQKSIKLANSRYQNQQAIPSRQKIKFNKVKSKIVTKKSQEQMDFVRTSDAQFKITKNSLDMKPVF